MKKTVITLIFAIVIVFGFIFGSNLEIPYKYTAYIAVAILAFLDSLFGGIVSNMKNEFNMTVFVSGFFVNALIAIFLVYLGQKLNVDIYLAAVIVFTTRLFTNLSIIRRLIIENIEENKKNKKA
ncbi:MAG: small basic family protein [Clostridia bacterium]|nr:small basic family protein [Clostridia bacterium]MBR6641887.1 small basic family protein [Clostridia bacterium]